MNFPASGMVKKVSKEIQMIVTAIELRDIRTQQDFDAKFADAKFAGRTLSGLAKDLMVVRGIDVPI